MMCHATGAYSEAGEDDTAFGGGSPRYAVFLIGMAPNSELGAAERTWVRGRHDALRPWSRRGLRHQGVKWVSGRDLHERVALLLVLEPMDAVSRGRGGTEPQRLLRLPGTRALQRALVPGPGTEPHQQLCQHHRSRGFRLDPRGMGA